MFRLTSLILSAVLALPAMAQDAVPPAPATPTLPRGSERAPVPANDDVQVTLPVAEDVEGTPIYPAEGVELEEALILFSETKNQFSQRDGGVLYFATCAACHMPDAKGAAGAGAYPPLAGNPKMISPYYIATVLLTGYHGMPRFGNTMDDAQIAAVTNYVRTHFGNEFEGVITADEVAHLRGE